MRLEDYTDKELEIRIEDLDLEIEQLQRDRDLFERQRRINNNISLDGLPTNIRLELI